MTFHSRAEYAHLLYALPQPYPEIVSSMLHFSTTSATTGLVNGSVHFHDSFELRLVEVLDFAVEEILDSSSTLYRQGEEVR